MAILHESGVAQLTTRAVSARAQVSEGSIFYHFKDRLGLLTAAIEDALSALLAPNPIPLAGPDLPTVLSDFMDRLEAFLEHILVILVAARSDPQLQAALQSYLGRNDLGPHRGITLLADYFRHQQNAGIIRSDVNPEALAAMVYSCSFQLAGQQYLLGPQALTHRPSQDLIRRTLRTLLQP
jgi:AcrR family transcriptional regulator